MIRCYSSSSLLATLTAHQLRPDGRWAQIRIRRSTCRDPASGFGASRLLSESVRGETDAFGTELPGTTKAPDADIRGPVQTMRQRLPTI